MVKIGVVIVTYNRVEKLKQTLDLFAAQTSLPDYIMIIDNASTDATQEVLTEWREKQQGFIKKIIRMEKNSGGSGGFYEGLKESLGMEADWIWVSDDDAFPEKDAIEQARIYLKDHISEWDCISAICGQVINQNRIDINHRKIYRKRGIYIEEHCIPETEYQKTEFQLNAFSYVGTIINRDKMKQAGLTCKEYFIWWDDTEHSMRLSKAGKILCVPAIRIHHDVGFEEFSISWKTYYGFRNMTDMYHRHFPGTCYYYFVLKIIIKTTIRKIFRVKTLENRILKEAYLDAARGRLGIHPIYKPGWKP